MPPIIAVPFGLAVVLAPVPASADHGGSPNLTVTPNSELDDTAPFRVRVSATGLPAAESVIIGLCRIEGMGMDCTHDASGVTDAAGSFSARAEIEYSWNGQGCDWSATVQCRMHVWNDRDPPSWPYDTADISFAGHDIRPTCDGQAATIYVDAADHVVGGPLNGQPYMGRLDGTSGPDVIVGTGARDDIAGKAGNDRICGRGDNDVLKGSAGADRLFGQGGNDTLTGGTGADRFNGGTGTDTATDFTPGQGDTKTGVENF